MYGSAAVCGTRLACWSPQSRIEVASNRGRLRPKLANSGDKAVELRFGGANLADVGPRSAQVRQTLRPSLADFGK